MNRVAIITGASRGLGFEFAHQLLQRNYHVAICSSNQDNIEKAYDTLIRSHPNAQILYTATDMTNPEAVKTLFNQVQERFNRLDLCINNVGYLKTSDFLNTDLKLWKTTLDLNLTSCYLASHEAFHLMKNQPGIKHILNISSLSGIRFVQKFKGMSAYIASKHAVVGLTESLAVEGHEYDIRVNCLAPGSIKTRMFEDNFPDYTAASTAEKVALTGLKLCDDYCETAMTGCTMEFVSDTL